ncbi:unnamed protein product [Durusdinium trenchii]|uniref:Uncharacterized protein n=2 Tax=Durusdinium trenchii TaxID=1381693 RepID=A0ABP0QLW5_9DINO
MSSFTQLLLEKGVQIRGEPSLPHRSRRSESDGRRSVPALDEILAQMDQEAEESQRVPCFEPEKERPEKVNDGSQQTPSSSCSSPWLFEASSAAQKRSEAFESIQNQSFREDVTGPVSRQKPRSQKETRKPTHWNFSFNVNREVVGAELLEVGEDGELQPPAKDPKTLPRTGKGKAEPLPGLPSFRQGPPRVEPGLARWRPIPSHNEWVAGLQKMAEANRPKDQERKPPPVPAEEFLERGSPLEKRPFRCLRSEVVYCSVNCLCDDWKP